MSIRSGHTAGVATAFVMVDQFATCRLVVALVLQLLA